MPKFIPFTAQTRMSGVDVDGSSIRKGAVDAIIADVKGATTAPLVARELEAMADEVAHSGGTPLAVARDGKLLGVIHLKDIVKGGIRERFADAAQDGHPHGDDHRRQSRDGRRHRRRGRRRRLPRPGDARRTS